MSGRRICPSHPDEPAPGGLSVCVEVLEAYTDGSSRHDRVFIPWASSHQARVAAVLVAHNREPALAGVDLDAFESGGIDDQRATGEEELEELYRYWKRWQDTADKVAVIGGASNPTEQTALDNAVSAAWKRYWVRVQAWLAYGPVNPNPAVAS